MVPVYVGFFVSTFVVFRTSLRHLFNPVLHVALPLIGTAVMVYPLWSLSPLGGPQAPPYDDPPVVVLVYLVAGIAIHVRAAAAFREG